MSSHPEHEAMRRETLKEQKRERELDAEYERKQRMQKLQYLAAAHHTMRRLMVDEEHAVREYEDLANMLELAGSKTVCETIRKIGESEKRHALDLKTAADMLNQAIKQLERIRELKKMEKPRK